MRGDKRKKKKKKKKKKKEKKKKNVLNLSLFLGWSEKNRGRKRLAEFVGRNPRVAPISTGWPLSCPQ
jgi:hypothetical protein